MKLTDIKLNDRNPRKIGKEALDKLKESIQRDPEFMKLRFIVIDDNNMVLGGNQRLKALKALGYKDVPDDWIVRASDLTEEQRRRFILADNAPEGMAGIWDVDLLTQDWEPLELEDLGFDLDALDPGGALDPQEGQTDPDEVPEEPEEPITQPGDLWVMGEHRLLCGDSTNAEDVERVMGGEKADMVFTDPPYGMNLDPSYADVYKNAKARARNQNKVAGDEKPFDPSFWLGLFDDTEEQFWWGCDYYQNRLPGSGSVFVWDKVCESIDGRIGNEFELCWSKQRHKKEIIHIKWAGFLGLKKEDGSREHPTQKPVRLVDHFVSAFSREGDSIADPFLGSGTTIIACEQLGRKCRAIEISPAYVDVAVKRWEDFTGEKAVRHKVT